MATLDLTAFDYALEILYPDDEIIHEAFSEHPALAVIPKDEKWTGKSFWQPVKYAHLTGRGGTFANALANRGPSSGVGFTVTRSKNYAVCSVDRETIKASETDEGALMDAIESEMDDALDALNHSMGIEAFGDGSGQIGTISTILANVITLTDAEQVTNFDVGQKLVFADSTALGLRDSGTSAEVSSIDRDAGTVTIDSTPTGTVDGDVIFVDGDYVSAGDRTRMMGFGGWITTSTPAALFGVTRTTDKTRLAGCAENVTGLPVNEALVKIAKRVSKEKGRPDYAFVSFDRFEELVNVLGNKVEYMDVEAAGMGFSALVVRYPKGKLMVLPDIACPGTKAYVVTSKSWKIKSLGPAPHIFDDDGKWLREPTADAYQARVGYYGNLITKAPAYSGVAYNFGS